MQETIQKINLAKKNKWTRLDLSGLRLTELPVELFELVNLQSLVLGRYRTAVKNAIKNIPPDIGKLINLEVLDLTDNQISELPEEIAQLKKLKRLVLSNNRLRDFPNSICELSGLEELFIGNNRLSALPEEIQQLKKLHTLRINSNDFKTISNEINLIPNLQHLFLSGNPIKNVPFELIGTKEDVFQLVKQWFLDKGEGESYIYEAKLILVGEAEAGKTSLSNKLRNPQYELKANEPMTKGIEVEKWQFEYQGTQIFDANIWDFGGQDIMHATHRYFLTERSLYVLVVDIRAEKTDFYYWLNTIELFSGKSPVIIVMNEKHAYRKELSNTIRERFKDIIIDIFYVNLKINEGLEALSQKIKSALKSLPHIGNEKMPNKWLSIRNALQNRKDDFISFDEYEKIARHFGVNSTEQSIRIAKILHELGVILHFQNDPILRNTIILDKSWATEAVYLVLLDKKVTKNFGKVAWKDLDRIWEKYPLSKRNDLIQLMLNFLLCYEVEKNKSYIIPQLLPENPNKGYDEYFDASVLYFRISYPKFMPKGIISQLIVKMNKYIHDNLQWKTGVVLKIDNVYVEVTEDFFDKKINIKVCGSDKRNVLSIIRKEINEINDTFEKLEFQEEVSCGCLKNEDEEKPFFIKRKTLEKYKEKDEREIKCEVCLKNLNVLKLLDIVGNDGYVDELENKIERVPNKEYILNLMASENREIEFKATFLVPVYSKEDKKFLEDEYPQKLKKAEELNKPEMKEATEKKRKEIEDKLKTKEQEDVVIHSVLKTLVAFANSNGGELVIGIDEHKDDTPYIFGMEKDLEKVGGKDALMKKFDDIVENRIGNFFAALIEKRYWITMENKEVWLLRIKPSTQEVYCNNGKKDGEKKEMFYIRREVSTVELEGRELVKYTKQRF